MNDAGRPGSLNVGSSEKPSPASYEDMVWLFTNDNRNRGIIRMNFDEAALTWRSVQATTGSILEIGRRHGGSTCLILAASGTRKVTSMDIAPEHHPASDGYFARPENRSRLNLVVGDSRVAIPGQSYGFIFFDGDHSYEGVRDDVLAHWNVLVSLDGVPALAAFHDAVPNPGLKHEDRENFSEGVQRVCEALVANGCAEILDTAGSVLILRKLANVQPEVFSATDRVPTPEPPPQRSSQSAEPVAGVSEGEPRLQVEWQSATRVQITEHHLTVQNRRDWNTETDGTAFGLPFSEGAFDTVFNQGSLSRLDDASLPRWLTEIHRVSNRNVWVTIETTAGRDRAWWESRYFEAGFRKHPLGNGAVLSEPPAKECSFTLLFEKIPTAALELHPLEKLRAERDLHMDMLRESGLRSEAHIARYTLARTHLRPGMVVLDAACGLGYGAATMAAGSGVARVIGVDLSEGVVTYARDNYAPVMPQLEFHAGDATQLRFLADASVDVVVSFETLEHLANPDHLLREFSRVLKPGGLFIGSVPNLWIDEQGRNPVPYHLHVYDHAQFREQVAKHFEWQALYRQNAGGGWKRPQLCQLRAIVGRQPTSADLQDAEWWIGVATKPAVPASQALTRRDGQCGESPAASPSAKQHTLNPDVRIVVLDEEQRHVQLYGRCFDLLRVRPEWRGNQSPEEVLASKPDAILLSREWSYSWRLIAAAARRADVPVIYVMDGIIEWSYVWNNLSFVKPEGTVLQPLLASHLCVVGRHPARILAGLGLADRIHVVGLPRMDGLPRIRTLTSGEKPRILIATAKTFAHNVEQRTLVRKALRDLKSWFDANPFVLPVWRIADEVADEIGVQPNRIGTFEEALAQATGTISFLSTCLIESMFKGLPTALLDYRATPLYVQTAWEIRCAEHIPGVIQELLYPPPEKLAFQEQCLEDELEMGNASERLSQVICQAIGEAQNPSRQPQAVLGAEFGKLDFHQVHSQLSGFSASLQAPLQYELDALQNLYDRARRELRAVQATSSGQPEVERLTQLSREREETIRTLDQICRERQATIEHLDRLCRERDATIRELHARAAVGPQDTPPPPPHQPAPGTSAPSTPPPAAAAPSIPSLPTDRAEVLERAQAACQHGDLPAARNILETALRHSPEDASLHEVLGNLEWQAGEYGPALAAYRQAALRTPGSAEGHLKVALAAWSLRDLAACDTALATTLALERHHPAGLELLGSLRLEQGRVVEAGRCFERLLDGDPDHVPALLGLAKCEYAQGDAIAARLDCLRVLRLQPQNLPAREWLTLLDARQPTRGPQAPLPIQQSVARPEPPSTDSLVRRWAPSYANAWPAASFGHQERACPLAPKSPSPKVTGSL